MPSILTTFPDGSGFYYGYHRADPRQINLRWEPTNWDPLQPWDGSRAWAVYVAGKRIGFADSFADGEAMAIQYVVDHPDPDA